MRLNLATGLLLTVPLTAVQASRSVPRQVPPSGLEAVGSTQDFFLRTLLTESADYGNLTSCRNSTGPFKVGIVGAGAAGLYSAILLQSLGIDYEILELTERIGGRIYTYRFDETAWNNSKPGEPDYYNYYVSSSPYLYPIFPIEIGDLPVPILGCWCHALPRYAMDGPCYWNAEHLDRVLCQLPRHRGG